MTIKVVLCTAPSEEVAHNIAKQLVESKLAACVNIIRGVQSVYAWESSIQTDTECQLIIKTNSQYVLEAYDKVSELHPYDVPEWLELNAEASHSYGTWLQQYLQSTN